MEQDRFINYVDELVRIAKENGITREDVIAGLNRDIIVDPGSFMEEYIEKNDPSDQDVSVLESIVNGFKTLSRVGVGFIPVAGDALDLYEILTGKDAFTGEQLTGFQRTISCMGVLA
ncbi:MAG: pre-toxin TG domain-containing protein [Spirochaetia bacterium]|nr:pre-toxin TG domain-containing protein [Spirochaetia bacterium]